MSARHPQVRQGKQRHHLSGVLGQAPEAHLGVTKLTLDHPERMLGLGANLGLGLLDFTHRLVQRAAFAVFLVGAVPRRNLPDDLASRMLLAFLDPCITSIGAHHALLAVQQFVDLGDVRDIGRRDHHAVYQS
ncbi:hypothetical protein D3C85_1500970 [compost metagenome]